MEDNNTKAADAGGQAAPRPRSKAKLALILLLCGVLAGGAYVLGSKKAAAKPSAEPAAAECAAGTECTGATTDPAGTAVEPVATTIEEPAIGHVIDLEALSLNLADGRYLRVAVSLGLGEGVKPEPETFATAPAQDIVVSTLSGRSIKDLASDKGRDAAKAELTEHIIAHYGEDVIAVYLTEFVMQ